MTRRTRAQIDADERETELARALHAQAAADHIAANPGHDFTDQYRALAAQTKESA